MFPNPVVVRAFALRSAGIWLGLRATTALVLAVNDVPPFPRSAGSVHLFILIAVLLCFADVRRRRERVLIGNLGIPLWVLAHVWIIPPIIGELLLLLLGAATLLP